MKKVFNIIWKSLLTGAGYVIALMFGGMIVRLTGKSLPEVKDTQTILLWSFAGGIIMGLFLGSIATTLIASKKRHTVIWSTVIFFNLISVAIEGHFFAPELVGNFILAQIIQLILTAFVTGWLISILFAPKETTVTVATTQRSLFSWIWRFITSALSYLVFYFFFGAINYSLVTKPYYETHVGGLTAPSPETVLMVELIRGVLIVLSVLPFLLSKRMNRKQSVMLTGLILFSIGGLVPLTMQVNILPILLLGASAIEIFFQNFLTGAVTAILLGKFE